MELRLGLPKGSLQESTFRLFKKAGFNISANDRSYYPGIDDPELDGMLIGPGDVTLRGGRRFGCRDYRK